MVHQNRTDANQPAGGDGLDKRDATANTPTRSADSQHARSFEVDGLPSIRTGSYTHLTLPTKA